MKVILPISKEGYGSILDGEYIGRDGTPATAEEKLEIFFLHVEHERLLMLKKPTKAKVTRSKTHKTIEWI